MSNDEHKPTAVVVGRNYCNILTTARALGEAGYEVEAIKIFKSKPNPLKFLRTMKPEEKSKYIKAYTEVVTTDGERSVSDHLCKIGDEKDKKILIPVDDYVCSAIDKALGEISKYYYAPSINNEECKIVELMDKQRQKELAKNFDLPLLQSWLIKSENGSFDLPNGIAYPCFIKPNVSMQSTKNTMAKCDSEDELKSLLTKYASKGDFEMLVEEFADIKDEYSILGVSTKGDAISPGVIKVIEGGHHERKGVAIIGKTVATDKFSDIITKCNEYIKSLNYTGMYDIDLIETMDGSIYFVELNFRAGASTYALNKCGVNIYKLYADSISTDKPLIKAEQNDKEMTFVSEKVLMEEYARGDMSIQKLKKYMNMADVYFVKDSDDKKPYKYFKKYYLHSTVLRLLYKVKG